MSAAKPVYLLAGRWGRNPDPIIARVIREISSKKPSIGYIGAASGDNPDFFKRMESYFHAAGAGATTLAPTVDPGADTTEIQKILQAADIVFISGGDVEAGMNILRQRNLVNFLKELHLAGKPFFAISAGSIMLAQEWVRWRNPEDDTTAELFPCLGIASVICDTHGEADGWEELLAALKLEKPGTIGYGIVSGNALIVNPDGSVAAAGGAVQQFIRRRDRIEPLPNLLP